MSTVRGTWSHTDAGLDLSGRPRACMALSRGLCLGGVPRSSCFSLGPPYDFFLCFSLFFRYEPPKTEF